MEVQKEKCLQDAGRLLSRLEDFLQVDCPACGSKEYKEKFNKLGFSYVSCASCGTIFMNPRPSKSVLVWFYQGSKNYKYWNDVIFPASEEQRRNKIMIPRVDRLLELCDKYDVGFDTAMEVGAGFGTFCEELQSRKRFTKVLALEPMPELAETCRKRGLNVVEMPIEDFETHPNEKIDVIAIILL